MKPEATVRPIQKADYQEWRQLWDGYNAFYGREQTTALPEPITMQTWGYFFSQAEPVHAQVAELNGKIVGLVHYLFHRSTSRITDVCYLQDLFTSPEVRGQGIGRALILRVYQEAARAGSSRVYWTTQESNAAGRLLYDKIAKQPGFIIYNHELPRDA